MPTFTGRTLLRAGAAAALSIPGVQAVQAQQILTSVSSELDVDGPSEGSDRKVSTVAGQQVSTTYGGANSKALTDYGVNKLRAQGNTTHKQTVNSAWLDSYTVGGAAGTMVDLTFTITIDGMAHLEPGGTINDAPNYNFQLFALRGSDWAYVGDESSSYDVLSLTRTLADGTKRTMNARDFNGVTAFNASGVEQGRVFYDSSSDTYLSYAANGTYNAYGKNSLQAFFADGRPNGPVRTYAAFPGLGVGRTNLESNYALLGWGRFCDYAENECPSVTTAGTDVTVAFKLAAGATFSLAGTMFADDIYDGTVDFFNTAKMTRIGLSPGGSLTSASGSLVDLGNGQYGYRAVLAANVPEPATWALFILGFGIIGNALRWRARKAGVAKASVKFA